MHNELHFYNSILLYPIEKYLSYVKIYICLEVYI